ncbi:hypothetical protein [Cellulomonas sp.]|uniref:hypothetical protein n=1 Tax=Cellulomonas sp. TaxID=40001 RepID=UPI003BAC9718
MLAVIAAVGGLTACAVPAAGDPSGDEPDNWVVVSFADTAGQFDLDTMDSLLDTELAADEALQAAGAGGIDGNEIGEHQYDIYFVGTDREEMWSVLEPVFAAAPIMWSRVELHDGLDDPATIVVAP